MLGIDASLTGTGIAVDGDTFTIAPKKLTGVERMDYILSALKDYTSLVDLAVIEGLAYGSTTGSAMERAGLWWRIKTYCAHNDIPLAEVAPTARAKYATGKGNAGKDEVMIAVTKLWPDWDAKNNNEADAVILSNMGLDHLDAARLTLPKANRDALEKVVWP